MVYGQVARVTENNEISCVDGNSWENTWRSIIIDGIGTFAHQGMFHHRSIFELYGMFDESFQIAGDYELLIRAFKDGGNAYFCKWIDRCRNANWRNYFQLYKDN